MNNLQSRNDHFLDRAGSRANFTGGSPFAINRKKTKNYMKTEAEEKEIREENRKIRYLRFLVDFSILSIQQDDLLFEEAQGIVENVKRAACSLFPEKEETFELIYRPRFNRVIRERFGFSRESGGSESI
jgi:hypothetical protein